MEQKPFFPKSLYNKPAIINKEIYLFLHSLLKTIFIERNFKKNDKLNEHLKKWVEKINNKMIIKEEYFLSTEYDMKNLRNIILFVKSQNLKYCGDIIESILIHIFSFVFETEQDNSFGKYIFNNLTLIREHKNPDLIKWIKGEKFKPSELKNIEELFETDKDEDGNNNYIKNQKHSTFYNFLRLILQENYSFDIFLDNKNNKNDLYLYNSDFFYFNFSYLLYNEIKTNIKSILDKDIATNSIMSMVSNLFSSDEKPITQLIRLFFTEVYIFYQNKHSPLLEYTKHLDGYATIPFVYDLRGACIEGRYSHTIFSPLIVQDFYTKIFLKQNNLREMGMFELGKVFTFNDKIESIESETCLIKPYYIDFMLYAMGLFDNNSVESIDISYNYLREISDEFIYKILKHFKGLKTLNISSNEIKGGAASIFVILKKLYRTKKSKLENLILTKCLLDNSSIYELGELLKCRYCKLKMIVLNNNSLPKNSSLLKKMKKNKILEEVYLNKMDLGNSYVDDILRLISNTNIRYLYVYKNKMNNFNDFLRIINRTKIVKNMVENNLTIPNEETSLTNLDLSNNEYSIKNSQQIKLLKKIIKETSLYCLDISHILKGSSPEKWKLTENNKEYTNSVEDIKKYLAEMKKKYDKINRDIRINKVDIEKNKDLKKEMNGKMNGEKLREILSNKNVIYSTFLQRESEKYINNINENKSIENTEENIEKMVNYLILKRSEKKLEDLESQKHQKKLIII